MTPRHLMVAFDFSDASRRALELAHFMSVRLRTGLDVVFVHEDPFSALPDAPAASLWATSKERDDHEARIAAHLDAEVAEVFGADAQAVTTRVLRGRVVPTLIRAATDANTDLIVVGTTGKGGITRALMGSVSQKLVQTSPVPVVSVP